MWFFFCSGDKAKFDFRNLFHFGCLHTITINKHYRVNAEDSYVRCVFVFLVSAEGDIETMRCVYYVLVFNLVAVLSFLHPFAHFRCFYITFPYENVNSLVMQFICATNRKTRSFDNFDAKRKNFFRLAAISASNK